MAADLSETPRPSFRAPVVAVALILFPAMPASAQHRAPGPLPACTLATRDIIAASLAEASRRFGVPQVWLHSVLRVESAGRACAVSPKGAMGLMQVMPGTYAELRTRYRLGPDPFNVRDNILAGAAYLRELYDRFGAPGFLAAYNAGPARYQQHLAGRSLPLETRAYVAKLASSISGPSVVPPPPISSAKPSRTAPVPPVDALSQALRSPLFAGSEPSAELAEAATPDVSGMQLVDADVAPQAPREGIFIPLSRQESQP